MAAGTWRDMFGQFFIQWEKNPTNLTEIDLLEYCQWAAKGPKDPSDM